MCANGMEPEQASTENPGIFAQRDPQEYAERKGGSVSVNQSYRLEGTTGPRAIRTSASWRQPREE